MKKRKRRKAYFKNDRVTIYKGDCIEVMQCMDESSVDTIITDPPYGLEFMGKRWDHGVPGIPFWAEMLRVAKPGAMLLAFGGTRTHHRLMCAIEDAGWEIRDCVMWVYGSGFPKSHNISKATDRRGGKQTTWFGVWLKKWRQDRGLSQRELCGRCGFFGDVNRGGTISNWEIGLGSPTVEQFNCICKALSLPFVTMREGRRQIIGTKQTGPGVAFSSDGPTEIDITAPATDLAKRWDGWGTALKPAWEPIILAMKPLDGTFAANAEKHGVAGLHIDGARVGPRDRTDYGLKHSKRTQGNTYGDTEDSAADFDASKGRWPANVVHDGSAEVVGLFPNTKSGAMKRTVGAYGGKNVTSFLRGKSGPHNQHGDSGSAARFFYCAKASKSERNSGLPDGTINDHPTVKPVALLEYLCNLTRTPAGGVILDPFAGSGSTGIAARRAGRRCIMIEQGIRYCVIAKYRSLRGM